MLEHNGHAIGSRWPETARTLHRGTFQAVTLVFVDREDLRMIGPVFKMLASCLQCGVRRAHEME